MLAAIGAIYFAWKNRKPILTLVYGVVLLAGGGYFSVKGTLLTTVFFSLAGLMITSGLYLFIKGRKEISK